MVWEAIPFSNVKFVKIGTVFVIFQRKEVFFRARKGRLGSDSCESDRLNQEVLNSIGIILFKQWGTGGCSDLV